MESIVLMQMSSFGSIPTSPVRFERGWVGRAKTQNPINDSPCVQNKRSITEIKCSRFREVFSDAGYASSTNRCRSTTQNLEESYPQIYRKITSM